MNLSEEPKPLEHVGTALTRRVVLTAAGGMGLTAFLAACGTSRVPHPTGTPTVRIHTTGPHVRITTYGKTFSPSVELTAGSTATVSWEVEGGVTVTGINPTINLGPAAASHVRMSVHEEGVDALDKVTTFNLGFNHLDDMGVYIMAPAYDRAPEKVTLLENISLLKGLIRFAAAHTALAGALDFTGCSLLQYVECLGSNIESVNVTGCTSLIRLVMEQNNLTNLNLNPVAANLRDLRSALQQGGTLTMTPLNAPLARLYHFCVVDQVVVNHPTSAQLPVVKERWDWNTHQSGALTTESSAIGNVRTAGNHYTTADLTNQFPSDRNGILDASHNELTAVILNGCSGLHSIDLSNNKLNTAAVDTVLALVASWGSTGGLLNLAANSAPSSNGVASRATLTGHGWTVTIAT
jgi:Leucine-rich repeat (LRR) protein